MQKDIKTQSVVLSILIVASLIVGYFITVPFWRKLSTARGELVRAQLDQKNFLAAQADLENFLQKFTTLSDKAEIAAKALPSEPQAAVLLASIEQLANGSGLALASVNVIDSAQAAYEPAANSVIAYDVQISGSGSYFSFKDFLNRLERHLRITDLQSLNFKVDEANNLGFELQIRTYYQK